MAVQDEPTSREWDIRCRKIRSNRQECHKRNLSGITILSLALVGNPELDCGESAGRTGRIDGEVLTRQTVK